MLLPNQIKLNKEKMLKIQRKNNRLQMNPDLIMKKLEKRLQMLLLIKSRHNHQVIQASRPPKKKRQRVPLKRKLKLLLLELLKLLVEVLL